MAAIDDAIARLGARTLAEYLADSGYIEIFPLDLNATAVIGAYSAAAATATAASAALVAASVATAQAIVGLTQKVGTDVLSLPRNAELGGCAYIDFNELKGIPTLTNNAAYQILVQDWGKLLLTTTGTNTYTLPLAADLPDNWFCMYKNRSGNNLTINRTSPDTFNAAATTINIATAAAVGYIIRTSSTTFEVGP